MGRVKKVALLFLVVLLIFLTLAGAFFAAGFFWVGEGKAVKASNTYYGRSIIEQSAGAEGRTGIWWSPPLFQKVENFSLPNGWVRPGYFQLMKAYKYWTRKVAIAEAHKTGFRNDQELEDCVDELLLVYATYAEDYDLGEWGTHKPENILFFKYDREFGWRLGGQFAYGEDQLTLNHFYLLGKPWGNCTVRDTVAHELWHAQGMWFVLKLDAERELRDANEDVLNPVKWTDYYNFLLRTDESYTQIGSSDVLGHALEIFGPKYEAAFYNAMRSFVAGTLVYYAWYDGDSITHLPQTIAEADAMRDKWGHLEDVREMGRKVDSTWRNPYQVTNRTEFQDILYELGYYINEFLWNARRTAMQKEYWEMREWSHELRSPGESLAARNVRFRRWLAMPEAYAGVLMQYDVMPVVLLLGSRRGWVVNVKSVPSAFGSDIRRLYAVKLEATHAEWWNGLAESGWAETITPWEYFLWLCEHNGWFTWA